MNPINLFDFEVLAAERVVPLAWEYFVSGAEDEYGVVENREAFRRIKLRPRVLADVARRDLSTTVLGQRVSLPVLLAPTSHQRMAHPDAELATPRRDRADHPARRGGRRERAGDHRRRNLPAAPRAPHAQRLRTTARGRAAQPDRRGLAGSSAPGRKWRDGRVHRQPEAVSADLG